jgi:hypothetical protein
MDLWTYKKGACGNQVHPLVVIGPAAQEGADGQETPDAIGRSRSLNR